MAPIGVAVIGTCSLICKLAMSKFDKPASVTWSSTGPCGMPLPPNTRDFATLREALLFVRTLPHGSRKLAIHSVTKRYGAADIERLEMEMKQR